MFAVVRIFVPHSVHDPKRRITTYIEPDYVWNYVIENHKNWHTNEIKLLYITHRHLQEDTSLIVDAKDLDVLANFLIKHIATLECVRGIRILNMARMKFFRIPKDYSGNFSRFTVTIDAIPKYIEKLFEDISAFKPGRDIIINYIAQTFQSFTVSMIISVMARSRNHMEAFVNDYIKPLEGVVDAEITYISKTMRLVSPEEWKKSMSPYFIAPSGERIKDIEVSDDSLIAGC